MMHCQNKWGRREDTLGKSFTESFGSWGGQRWRFAGGSSGYGEREEKKVRKGERRNGCQSDQYRR
jgi:hypothetical protein